MQLARSSEQQPHRRVYLGFVSYSPLPTGEGSGVRLLIADEVSVLVVVAVQLLHRVAEQTADFGLRLVLGLQLRFLGRVCEDGTYSCWWGVDALPDLNEDNPEYRELICGKDGDETNYACAEYKIK